MKARRLTWLILLAPYHFAAADALLDRTAAERLWLNSGLTNYSYRIHTVGYIGEDIYLIQVTAKNCTAIFQSAAGMKVGAPHVTACQNRTIGEQFAELRRNLETEPTAVKELRFNPTYGYPEHMFIDPALMHQSETVDITDFAVEK